MKNTAMDMLRHTIGIDKDVDLTGEPKRNYYAVSVGTDDERELLSMAADGLVKPGRIINDGDTRYFHATAKGIERAREDERERRRAEGLRRWRVSYALGGNTTSRTVLAKSRSAAKWDVISDMLEANYELAWCFRNVRAHVARPTLGGIDVL